MAGDRQSLDALVDHRPTDCAGITDHWVDAVRSVSGLAVYDLVSSVDHAHSQLVVRVWSLSDRWAWSRTSADADCGRAHDAAGAHSRHPMDLRPGATGHGYALGALLSFTSIVIPWATAGAIRTAAER